MLRSVWLAILALLLPLLAAAYHEPVAAQADLLNITSNVVYDIRPDTGPTRVSWHVTFQNNDPATTYQESGVIRFYNQLLIPLLKGASAISAQSSSGKPLTVTLDEPTQSPALGAEVDFDRRVFYTESYDFTLTYELSAVRQQSLLVTPYYVYVPVIAMGDTANVTVNTPPDGAWQTNLEQGDCAQGGNTFSCSGSDEVYVAALAEVSRPDATATISFDAALKEKVVPVTLTYFQGEDAPALHVRDLVAAALPIVEDLAGFPYPGPQNVKIAQGGRQVILGYEGLTSCDPATACQITVSPIADDITILHELAHFWSDIYDKRWIGEGYAQIVAEEAAARLPPGLVQGQPPLRPTATVDLQLNDWGEVNSIIGASEDDLAIQDAGYDRSLRFFYILRHELSLDVLKQVNAAIRAKGSPVDSGGYLDLLEETSGKKIDDLFLEWVYPSAYSSTLRDRREARDRLDTLRRRASEEGLSEDIPNAIDEDVSAWRFKEALEALGEAEAGLDEYFALKDDLSAFTTQAESAGLAVPAIISESMKRWEFAGARHSLETAKEALEAYVRAQEKVNASRSIWERFGLLGSNPEDALSNAAAAFATGDFAAARERANDAANTIDNATAVALRRLLILGAIFGVFAAGIGVAVWVSHRQQREFAEP